MSDLQIEFRNITDEGMDRAARLALTDEQFTEWMKRHTPRLMALEDEYTVESLLLKYIAYANTHPLSTLDDEQLEEVFEMVSRERESRDAERALRHIQETTKHAP